jgi:hypothetical protein
MQPFSLVESVTANLKTGMQADEILFVLSLFFTAPNSFSSKLHHDTNMVGWKSCTTDSWWVMKGQGICGLQK